MMEHPLYGLAKGLTKSLKEVVNSPALNSYFEGRNRAARTILNAVDGITNLPVRAVSSLTSGDLNLEKGDHIYIQGLGYTHHGVYIGNYEVIHYDKGSDGRTSIQIDSLETFKGNTHLFKCSESASPAKHSRDEIVSRAYRKLGESSYNLIFNNCEHFVRWCRNEGEKSKQYHEEHHCETTTSDIVAEHERWEEAHKRYLKRLSR